LIYLIFQDGIPASEARLVSPTDIALDSYGNVYLYDYSPRIRVINMTTGIINSILNGGSQGYVQATLALSQIQLGNSIFIDQYNDIYISDLGNHRIREIINCQDKPDNTPCYLGLFCSLQDVCISGQCISITPNQCNQTNQCANFCNEASRSCANPIDTPCNSSLFCDGISACNGQGQCISQGISPCENLGFCQSICNESLARCLTPDNTIYQVNSFCTGNQVCKNGQIVLLGNPCSSSLNPCNNLCNPVEQNCINPIGSLCSSVSCSGYSTCGANLTCNFVSNVLPVGSACNVCGQCNSNSTCISPAVCPVIQNNVNMNIAEIAGGASAGVFALIIGFIIIGVIIYRLRKRNKKLKEEKNSIRKEYEMDESTLLTNIIIGNEIGSGNFGSVRTGLWNGTTEVALKYLNDPEKMKEFASEVNLLKKLKHPNIVQFYGCFIENAKYMIVMEWMPNGSLQDYLEKHKEDLNEVDLLKMINDTLKGMIYLEEKGIIHRDLAARNLLVSKDLSIKISDFGMGKIVLGEDYYNSKDKSIPIRWSAIEVLKSKKYSHKSDVWSFGVVIWEIINFGAIPYTGMTNQKVTEEVINGYKLTLPNNSPDILKKTLSSCLMTNHTERPTFKELLYILNPNYDELKSRSLDQYEIIKDSNENYQNSDNYQNIDNPEQLNVIVYT